MPLHDRRQALHVHGQQGPMLAEIHRPVPGNHPERRKATSHQHHQPSEQGGEIRENIPAGQRMCLTGLRTENHGRRKARMHSATHHQCTGLRVRICEKENFQIKTTSQWLLPPPSLHKLTKQHHYSH